MGALPPSCLPLDVNWGTWCRIGATPDMLLALRSNLAGLQALDGVDYIVKFMTDWDEVPGSLRGSWYSNEWAKRSISQGVNTFNLLFTVSPETGRILSSEPSVDHGCWSAFISLTLHRHALERHLELDKQLVWQDPFTPTGGDFARILVIDLSPQGKGSAIKLDEPSCWEARRKYSPNAWVSNSPSVLPAGTAAIGIGTRADAQSLRAQSLTQRHHGEECGVFIIIPYPAEPYPEAPLQFFPFSYTCRCHLPLHGIDHLYRFTRSGALFSTASQALPSQANLTSIPCKIRVRPLFEAAAHRAVERLRQQLDENEGVQLTMDRPIRMGELELEHRIVESRRFLAEDATAHFPAIGSPAPNPQPVESLTPSRVNPSRRSEHDTKITASHRRSQDASKKRRQHKRSAHAKSAVPAAHKRSKIGTVRLQSVEHLEAEVSLKTMPHSQSGSWVGLRGEEEFQDLPDDVETPVNEHGWESLNGAAVGPKGSTTKKAVRDSYIPFPLQSPSKCEGWTECAWGGVQVGGGIWRLRPTGRVMARKAPARPRDVKSPTRRMKTVNAMQAKPALDQGVKASLSRPSQSSPPTDPLTALRKIKVHMYTYPDPHLETAWVRICDE
ncbi:hypothetical protein FA13DRAFT_1712915 [Coprinellus micaceus]|uniref:Uncharacterized protein n=1 Tax=Coprinellus micaceus TaxID=71717 RepID=A0A4Y7SZ64_COPMI|nr:hypothetical protein FA13DRAFT_1712915 [Coprinellus micaceus]